MPNLQLSAFYAIRKALFMSQHGCVDLSQNQIKVFSYFEFHRTALFIYYLFLDNKKNLLLFLFIGSKQQATKFSFAQMKILVQGNSLSQSLLNLDSNCHPMNFLHHLLSQERFFRNVIYVLCFYCTLEDLQSLKEWIVTIQTVLLLEELKNSLLMNI